ncbi:PREDICTED: malonyl-coenzyme:anthocyanin 5-O-glucoside-6'''-O-malonyltransferase-like [Ipomoea nil]|uniref:malonyl-coenzyme:anthocyanin 5-O-glucoside-6'''-O-malonyltransferase-like n=1 Tax=Ipomoea nil TaxID=35883 RepID=UPI000900C99B|nr:PREDICTED: malonyl-coenzyme:anthocyanin 5-O-glucoside-6'''-O-malonyltransferase-like [Ipomoea nil]
MAQSSSPLPTYAAVLEQCSVAPPPGKVAAFSLPLTFLDLQWLHSSPAHRLMFYQHAVSRTHFKDTIIPHLKTSFSIALQYFPLIAAKLAVPSDYSTPPEFVYSDGDGVSLVFAVSDDNSGRFDCLSSNHARNCNEFYPLIPTLPSVRRGMFAAKVTLFPDAGICVGIASYHVAGDDCSIFGFMKAWTALSILAHKSSPLSLSDEYLPFLDRTAIIEDPKGLKTLAWNQMKHVKINEEDADDDGVPYADVTGKARATFIVTRNDIQKLKNHVISTKVVRRQPPSSFVVTCAYMWVCLLRSQCIKDDDDDDDTVYFVCAADCRARLDTPLPAKYFGNCIVPCIARAKARRLAAEECGLAAAAEAIGDAIEWQLQGEEGVLRGAENWMSFFGTVNHEKILSVSGSPRFDYYEMDFGWGKPKKTEITSIDTGGFHVGCAKESSDIEIGVSVPATKMHLLKTLFDEGLQA